MINSLFRLHGFFTQNIKKLRKVAADTFTLSNFGEEFWIYEAHYSFLPLHCQASRWESCAS